MPLVAISVAPALVFKAEAPLSDAVASEVDALPSVSAASTSPFWADTSSLDNELSLLTPDDSRDSNEVLSSVGATFLLPMTFLFS